MTTLKPRALSGAEQRFVAEYLVDFNATAALIRCGWAPHSADAHAVHYLRKPHVRAAIDQGIRRIEMHSVVSAARVLEEVLRVATADPRKAVRDDGTLKHIQELDEDTARAVASLKVVTKPGRGEEPPTVTHEIKFWDKGRAADTLLKTLGKLVEGVQVNNTTVINPGPGALEEARMLELENKLRETLGLGPVEAPESAGEGSAAQPAGEGVAVDDRAIEAASPPDLDDWFDDPAFR